VGGSLELRHRQVLSRLFPLADQAIFIDECALALFKIVGCRVLHAQQIISYKLNKIF